VNTLDIELRLILFLFFPLESKVLLLSLVRSCVEGLASQLSNRGVRELIRSLGATTAGIDLSLGVVVVTGTISR